MGNSHCKVVALMALKYKWEGAKIQNVSVYLKFYIQIAASKENILVDVFKNPRKC